MDVVTIDNSSPSDNLITNKANIAVTVACEEMFGPFKIDLNPGQSMRVTENIRANAYPMGEYSYNDLKYELGRGEKWEVCSERDGLILFMRKEGDSQPSSITDPQSSPIVDSQPNSIVDKTAVNTGVQKKWWQFWK